MRRLVIFFTQIRLSFTQKVVHDFFVIALELESDELTPLHQESEVCNKILYTLTLLQSRRGKVEVKLYKWLTNLTVSRKTTLGNSTGTNELFPQNKSCRNVAAGVVFTFTCLLRLYASDAEIIGPIFETVRSFYTQNYLTHHRQKFAELWDFSLSYMPSIGGSRGLRGLQPPPKKKENCKTKPKKRKKERKGRKGEERREGSAI